MFRLIYFTYWWMKCRIKRRHIPLKSVIVINYQADLENKTYQQIIDELKQCYRAGSRFVLFEGNPLDWTDGKHSINNVVKIAKNLGFMSVAVNSDAQSEIHVDADAVYIPLNGSVEIHDQLEGEGSHEKLFNNVANSKHKNIVAVMTVNKLNYSVMRDVAKFVAGNPNIKALQFKFYEGQNPDLELSFELTHLIVDKIIEIKKEAFPIRNSMCALQLLRKDDFASQNWITNSIDAKGLPCAECSVCENADKAEMSCLYNLSLEAILNLLKD